MSNSSTELSPDLGELFEFDEIESDGNIFYELNRNNESDLSDGVPLSVELSESLCRSAAETILCQSIDSNFIRAPEIFLRIDNIETEATNSSSSINVKNNHNESIERNEGNSIDSNESDASFVAIADNDIVELQYENEFVDSEISVHDSGHVLRPSQFESDNEQLLFEGKQKYFNLFCCC